MPSFIPEKPSAITDPNSFLFRGWFNKVWTFMFGESSVTTSQTASFTLTSDFFYPVDPTAGAVVVTLPPAADAGVGRKYVVQALNVTNPITFAASGTDVITGTTTIANAGDTVTFISDGVGTWYVYGRIGGGSVATKSQFFTASGTFTWPTGVDLAWVTLIGSGGGGGRGNAAATTGAGGGSAGEWIYRFPFVRTAATSTVTLNNAGTGAVANNTAGVAGGTSVFDTLIAAGGLGGPQNGNGAVGGGPNGASAPGAGAPGNPGSTATFISGYSSGGASSGSASNAINNVGGRGGNMGQYIGAAGGASNANGGSGGGGASTPFGIGGAGGAGGNPGVAGTSAAATSYGAGGGGGGGSAAGATGNGGNGTKGACLVEWIA